MLKRSLLLVVLTVIVFSFVQVNASAVRKQTAGKGAPSQMGIATPSSPDNWLGGTGNWSNGSDWSAGLPGGSSDVTIGTGNDIVTLDTSASISSLTLGGSGGSSTLIDPGTGGFTVTIAGALTVNFTGTLTLEGTGDRIVAGGNSSNAGTINLEYGSNLHLANFTNSGTVNLDHIGSVSVSGTFTNTGALVDNGANDEGPGSFSAANVTNSGTLAVAVVSVNGTINNLGGVLYAGSLNAASMTNSGSVAGIMSRGNSFTIAGSLSNSGTFDTSYTNATIGSVNNTGTFIVGGTVDVHGDFQNSNQLQEGNLDILGQSLTVGGTLSNTSAGAIQMEGPGVGITAANLTNQGSIDLEQSSVLDVSQNVTNSGTIKTGFFLGGGNTITISGKLTNNTGGSFQLLGAGDVATIHNVVNTGAITVGNGATLNVPPSSHAAGNALAGFLNAGSVLISSGGTLSSPSSYLQNTGQTTVDGRLSGVINFAGGSVYGNGGTIAGTVTSNASLNFGDAPMTVGQLTFAGNFTQGANGGMTFDIASQNSYDKMNITGQARLNGMMMIDLLNGYVPQVGNLFEIMSFASESGTFSNVVGLPINGQEHFVLEYNANNLTLDVVSGGLAGLSSLKTGSTNSEPYIQLAESTGQPMETGQGPLQTTPEPGSLLLLASGMAGTIGWMRRRWVR
jgi:PEP-CTERM motif